MCFNFDHYFVEFDKFIQSNVQIWYRSGLASGSGIRQFIVLAIPYPVQQIPVSTFKQTHFWPLLTMTGAVQEATSFI